MQNKLSSVPKKELIFISIVLVVLIVMIVLDTDVEILVNYDEEMLQITSPRLNIDIEHAHVLDVQLIDMPAFGTKIGDSYEHEAYCAGTWENDTWGSYTLCVIPGNQKAIVVEVANDGFVVFNCTTDEKTETLFTSYSTYLNN